MSSPHRPFLLSFLDLLLTVRVKLPPNGSYCLDYGLKVQKAGLCLSMGNRVKILCFPFKCHLNIIYWTNNIINITMEFILMKRKNALNSTILVNNFVSLCFLPDQVYVFMQFLHCYNQSGFYLISEFFL